MKSWRSNFSRPLHWTFHQFLLKIISIFIFLNSLKEFLGLSPLVTLLDPKRWLIHKCSPSGAHQTTCHLILVIQKPKNLCCDEGITHWRIHSEFWDVEEETQTIFFVELIVKYEQTEILNFSESERDSTLGEILRPR